MSERQKIAQAFVTELGIDEAMVVAVIDAIPDGPTTEFKTDEENIAAAARALSTILEVANGTD